jgi:hypothetical protein
MKDKESNTDFYSSAMQSAVDKEYALEFIKLLGKIASNRSVDNSARGSANTNAVCDLPLEQVLNIVSEAKDLDDAVFRVGKALYGLSKIKKYRNIVCAGDDIDCYEIMEKVAALYAGVSLYELRFIADVYARETLTGAQDISPAELLQKTADKT